ncbi:MAG: TlpA family protein disulfide reductase [Endomicrobium sp.]|jgi:thiol-disulfide isomerase/thioredoxin|nr:TlpA family protein disulfide reductase [Endomicrobium sp.]
MIRLRKIFLVLAFFSVFTFTACIGEKAPDFTLLSIKGNAVSLSDLKGKVVFLDFWASWCPPCRDSIPAIKEMYREYLGNTDVVILGINSGEDVQTVKVFMADMRMPYTVLYGTPDINKNYKVKGIPAFFVIDKNGKIAKKFIGYGQGMERQWKQTIDDLLK